MNTGDADLIQLSVGTGGLFALAHNCPAILGPGASCVASVYGTPTAVRDYTDYLVVSGMSAGVAKAAQAKLFMTGAGGYAYWAPTTLDFGSVTVGQTAIRTVDLRNFGTTTVDYSSLSGLPAGVTADASRCANVAAGSSCQVTLTFAPTESGGYSATGIHPTSATSSAYIANSLAVTGVGAGLRDLMDLSTYLVDFGTLNINATSSGRSVQLLNTGDLPFAAPTLSVTGPFTATHNCPSSIAAGASCTITVTATPTVTDVQQGSLVVRTEASNSPLTTVLRVTGSGYMARWNPASLDFGTVVVGSTVSSTATLYNDGNAQVDLSAQTGLPADVTVNAAGCTLSGGANCTVTFTYAPTAVGTLSATAVPTAAQAADKHSNTLSLSGAARAATKTMDLSSTSLSFSSVALGSTSSAQSFLVLNTGDQAITTMALASTGPFAATHNCTLPLAAGASCIVSVTATPTASGTFSGSVLVTTDATNSPRAMSLSMTSAGAYARWSTTSLDFGLVAVNSSNTLTATLFNDGTSAANFSTLTSLPAGLTASAPGCASLQPAASCTVTFTYVPTSAGSTAATNVMPSAAQGAAQHANTLSVSGQAAVGTFDVSTTSVNTFVANTGGTGTTKSFIVYSTGALPVKLNSVTFGASDPYALVSSDCAFPATLTTMGCTINVTYKPTTAGTSQAGTATVNTDSGTKTVGLSGGTAYNLTVNGQLVGNAPSGTLTAVADASTKGFIVAPTTVQLKTGSTVSATASSVSWNASTGTLSLTFGTLPVAGTYDLVVLDASSTQLVKQSIVLADPTNLSGQVLKMDFESSAIATDSGAYGMVLTTYGTPTFNTASARAGLKSANVAAGQFYAPQHAALGFGTGDFTMEMWVNLTGYNASNAMFFDMRAAGFNESKVTVYAGSDGKPHLYVNQTDRIIATTAIPLNTWTHLAVSRNSGTSRLYLNGVLQGSWVDATNYGTSAPLYIGTYFSAPSAATQRIPGSIDDVIVTKGTGKYPAAFTVTKATQTTSSTSLTVPSTAFGTTSAPALTTVTNTGTVNLNVLTASVTTNPTEFTIVNNCTTPVAPGASCTVGATYTPRTKAGTSTGAITFTTDGTTASQVVNLTATSTAAVVLDANFDTIGTPFADSTTFGQSGSFVAKNGVPMQVSTLGAGGVGSAYVAPGGYVAYATNKGFGYSTGGDFTIEGWAYSTDYRTTWGGEIMFGQNNMMLWVNGAGQPTLQLAGTDRIYGGTMPLNQWNHFAVTRASGTTRLFMNGALIGSYADTTDYGTTSPFYLSDYQPGNSIGQMRFNGWLDNWSVTNGQAKYTTAFTVARAAATLSKTDVVFADTNANATSPTQSFTVTNSGNAPLTVYTATATTGFSLVSNGCATAVAAGSNCTITAAFAPTASGAKTGTLTLKTNAATATVTVNLYGTALSATGGDPYWSSVVALLHGDGAEGGQVFTDSKGVRTWSVGGTGATVKTTAASSKFGGSSIYTGNGQYIKTNTAIALGTGDYTIEFWAQRTGTGGVATPNPPVYSDGWVMATTHAGYTDPGYNLVNWAHCNANGWNCAAYYYSLGAGAASVTANPYGNWNYVAISKSGSTVRLYVNGTLYNTLVYNPVYTMDGSTNIVYIGGGGWQGYIDELRITTVGRYTGPSIPVPTAAFPNN